MQGNGTSNGARGLLAVPFLLTLSILGCRDAGTKAANLVNDQSTVSVRMVGEPTDRFQKLDLFITQVDIKADGAWHTLAKPAQAFALKGGGEASLAEKVRLPRGAYRTLRLYVDPKESRVVLADGTARPLGLPEGLKAGILLGVTEGPSDTLVHDLIITVSDGRSVRRSVDGAGASSYLFAPVAAVNDRNALGVIAGRLVDAAGKPLKDVAVTAQDGEGGLGRALVRTVPTGADGTYTLDLLPVNHMYYVVAQPQAGPEAFAAQASPGFQLTRLDRKKTFDFPAFQPATLAVGPKGAVARPASDRQFDEVELLQHLVTGERQGNFIVAATHAEPGAEGRIRYAFAKVPGGRYTVRLLRATLSANGTRHEDVVDEHAVEVGGDQPKTVDF